MHSADQGLSNAWKYGKVLSEYLSVMLRMKERDHERG
jgi:hypothetical protein